MTPLQYKIAKRIVDTLQKAYPKYKYELIIGQYHGNPILSAENSTGSKAVQLIEIIKLYETWINTPSKCKLKPNHHLYNDEMAELVKDFLENGWKI